ncbi:hypothetical protein [Actinomadura sp. WMMB 499]|uniref:hypothetical protein n=1 Tax=Actinomadura sp. WMMB 499 TaxID=1219491 RepID=UPI001247B3A1|nr:hypothetical protein [Actinomadura sp. WMMB 499]QFG22366.1 hypothetical protein F7P10_15745 [Actinomadura sp. WMMB 499]
MDAVQTPRVMVLALDPKLSMDAAPSVEPSRQYRRIIGLAGHFAAEEGARVDVVTAEPGGWKGLDERVRLHRLDGAEARHPLTWLEHTLVIRVPRLLVRPVARLGRPGRRLDRARTTASLAVHRRLFLPFYRHARPLVLSRVARRRLPDDADAPLVRVIVMDRTSVPLARRLARRHPDAVVTTRQDRDLTAKP